MGKPRLGTGQPGPQQRYLHRISYAGSPPLYLHENFHCVIVKLTTDDGVVGYGQAKAPVAGEATRQMINGKPLAPSKRQV